MPDLTKEQLTEISVQLNDDYGELEEWTPIGDDTIINQDRWHTYFEQVYNHNERDQWIRVTWKTGSTEYQECDSEYEVIEVWPHIEQVTVYKSKRKTE